MISSLLMDQLHLIKLLETSLLLLKNTLLNLITEQLLSTVKLASEEQELLLAFGQWNTSKSQLRLSSVGSESPDQVQFSVHNNSISLKWNQIIFILTNRLKKVESWLKNWMKVPRINTKLCMEKPIRQITWSEQREVTLKTNVNVNYLTTEQTKWVRLTHQFLLSRIKVLR